MNKVHINELINNLKINDKMKREFINLNYMYYNNYADGTLPQPYTWKLSSEYMALDLENKKKIGIGGSVFAFLFSFFAYIFRGLFLKGILFGIIIIGIMLIIPESLDPIAKAIGLGFTIFLALNLRKDYFYEKCLKNKHIHQMIKNNLVIFKPDEIHKPMQKNNKTSEHI